MKKLWKTLLSCLLMIVAVLSICCCSSKENLNIDKAKNSLEKANYDVEFISNPDPYDIDISFTNAIDKYLFAEGIHGEEICMILFDSEGMAKKYYKTLSLEIEYEISSIKADIKAYEYYLKHYKNKIKSDERNDIEDYINESRKELEDFKEEYAFGRSGKLVWFGNVDAINDAK